MVSRILVCLGLLLVGGGVGSCVSGEGECHKRAIAMLGCCPFCDPTCEVSKNADAQFAEDSCLADLAAQHDLDQDGATTQDGGTTHSDHDHETSLDPSW